MVRDTLAQLITALKNGGAAGKATVVVPHSGVNENVLHLLVREGYLESYAKRNKKGARQIDVTLKYIDGASRIHDTRRVSRSSLRIYRGFRNLFPFKQGKGLRIISSPSGIMTDREARKRKVGGEVLCEIW